MYVRLSLYYILYQTFLEYDPLSIQRDYEPGVLWLVSGWRRLCEKILLFFVEIGGRVWVVIIVLVCGDLDFVFFRGCSMKEYVEHEKFNIIV